MHGFDKPDGSIGAVACGCHDPEHFELDAIPSGYGPFMRDPANPRRAVPHAALIAAREVEREREAKIAAEVRALAIDRLMYKGEL